MDKFKKRIVNKSHELPVNIVGRKESNKNLQNGNAVNSKHKYTEYFNHKLNLLKLLKTTKDHIVKTNSYYCNICDFIAYEKHTWDNHNELVHPDNINNSMVFCTTCSMFILLNYFEEHNSSTEHNNLLKCIKSLNRISTKFILPLNNTISQNKQDKKSDTTTNALIKICDDITSKSNNSLTTIPTVSHETNLDMKIEETNTIIYEEISNDGVFLNSNETTAEKIDKKPVFMSSPCLKNVTDLKKVEKLYEDNTYGEYVTLRLNSIENAKVKQQIKFEIDMLFNSDIE